MKFNSLDKSLGSYLPNPTPEKLQTDVLFLDRLTGVNKARLVKMIEVSTTGEDSKTKERLIVREYWTVDGILIGRIVRPLPLNPGSRGDESAIH